MFNKIINMSLSDVLSCTDIELLELKAFELDFVCDRQRSSLLEMTNGEDYRSAIQNLKNKKDKDKLLSLIQMKSFNEKFSKKMKNRIFFLKNKIKIKGKIESKNENHINRIQVLELALANRRHKSTILHRKIDILQEEIASIKGQEYLMKLVHSDKYKSLDEN